MAFDITSVFNVPSSGTQELATLDIGLIRPDPKNKAIYKNEGIEDLAANIELVGLQQPLQVRPDPEAEGQYIAVSGHRRLEALNLLVSEGKDSFAVVPCMVVENRSEAFNELRLIFGNANTRKLSDWELSQQAQRVQELFYRLKEEEGIEFPGRMRDHVAQACQVSKSKLSRLKVINEGLEIFTDLWQGGKLSEAVAYELAQCPAELQWRIRDSRLKAEKLKAENVKRVREAWEEGCRWNMEHICSVTGEVCGHGDVALRRDLAADSYQHLCKGEECCLKCSYGPDCSYGKCERMCKPAADKLAADNQRRDEASAKAEKKRENAEREELKRGAAPYLAAAEAAGLAEDERLYLGYDSFTLSDLRGWVASPVPKKAWLFRSCRAMDVVKLADKLGCSADYLLGRTEVMAMPSQAASLTALPEGDPRWLDGEPERPGRYWCKVDFCDGLEPWLEDMKWTGQKWKGLDNAAVVIGWWPLPEG